MSTDRSDAIALFVGVLLVATFPLWVRVLCLMLVAHSAGQL